MLALQDCLLNEDLTPLLREIPAPALILASSQDEITPLEIQELMARRMPKAALETFDGVGHNMKVEIPELLAGRVLKFIAQVEAG